MILQRIKNCPFCDWTGEDVISHIEEEHYLPREAYYEMELLGRVKEDCFICGKQRHPLTYIDPDFYYLPCWDCITKKYERKQFLEMTKTSIKEYLSKVTGDRFLQMFLIADIYFLSTPSHTYDEFKRVLKELQKPSRDKIWFLDWKSGYPKTMSTENLEGLSIITADDKCYQIKNGTNQITINNWKVKFADIIPFDQRHHSRYNILNPSQVDIRGTKRLRLKNSDKDRCIKFYNTSDQDYKSIFQIVNDNDEPVELGEQDLIVTKLVLLRNKSFMRMICTVLGELIDNIGKLSDSVFLRNSVTINPDLESGINISWLPNKKKENYINISIL